MGNSQGSRFGGREVCKERGRGAVSSTTTPFPVPDLCDKGITQRHGLEGQSSSRMVHVCLCRPAGCLARVVPSGSSSQSAMHWSAEEEEDEQGWDYSYHSIGTGIHVPLDPTRSILENWRLSRVRRMLADDPSLGVAPPDACLPACLPGDLVARPGLTRPDS
jgi:hypothetical protein